VEKYKTEPLKCWKKAKEIRENYYRNYATAHEKGGIRWAGSGWAFDSVPMGLGEDVYSLTSEPYGAAIASDNKFSLECLEATEKFGFARDLCAYMRNYWGSVILNKYAFGGPFPKPDFLWTAHICCSHSKWYQVVSELEGGIPFRSIDTSVGPAPPFGVVTENKINYISGQLLDGIEWLQEITKRKFDDEKFIDAVMNHFRSSSVWGEISVLNQAVPAPLDEKTMYSLYVLPMLGGATKEVADYYEEVREEVKDRVNRNIAAIATEKCRIMSDSQPPWGFLKIFRYLEDYGCVSIGSIYTFGLTGILVYDDKTQALLPRAIPKRPKTREEACRALGEWQLYIPLYQQFYSPDFKSRLMITLAKQWKANGVILHLNRGCEGTGLGVMENRLALQKAGFPVMTYEGNMGDEREFDEARALARFDTFMELLGLKKLTLS
jgi:benzoyl-CoA reductase subunit B